MDMEEGTPPCFEREPLGALTGGTPGWHLLAWEGRGGPCGAPPGASRTEVAAWGRPRSPPGSSSSGPAPAAASGTPGLGSETVSGGAHSGLAVGVQPDKAGPKVRLWRAPLSPRVSLWASPPLDPGAWLEAAQSRLHSLVTSAGPCPWPGPRPPLSNTGLDREPAGLRARPCCSPGTTVTMQRSGSRAAGRGAARPGGRWACGARARESGAPHLLPPLLLPQLCDLSVPLGLQQPPPLLLLTHLLHQGDLDGQMGGAGTGLAGWPMPCREHSGSERGVCP